MKIHENLKNNFLYMPQSFSRFTTATVMSTDGGGKLAK